MTRPTHAAALLLPGLFLMLASGLARAEKLKVPEGMGGVPDIGSIPCAVFNDMMRVAPLGSRHSLLTWAAGYLGGTTGKSLQELVDTAADGEAWDYERTANSLVSFCKDNPKAMTRDAAVRLGRQLSGAP